MMSNRVRIFLLLQIFALMCGCEEQPYIPVIQEQVVSIAYLKSLYAGHPYRISGDIKIKGVVVANDIEGNFYRTIVIQDETGGIEVKLDRDYLYRDFLLGYEVSVYCNNLTLGAYGGALQLGGDAVGEYQTGYLPEQRIALHVKVVDIPNSKPAALVLDIYDLSNEYISRLVKFKEVQFADEELGFSWGSSEEYTNRTIVDKAGEAITVRTSPYASFINAMLPYGSGDIEGILGRFNGAYQLQVVTLDNNFMYGARF